MKKAIIAIFAMLPIVISGCDNETQQTSTPYSSVPAITSRPVTPQPSSSPIVSPSPNIPTVSMSPSAPVDPLSEFLNTEPDQGQKISEFTVSNESYVYYQMDGSKSINNKCIYRMDRKTGKSSQFANTGLDNIDQMFLDTKGCLYYLGNTINNEYESSNPALYKITGKDQKRVIDNISNVLYVDDAIIYYSYSYYIGDEPFTYIMNYDINLGVCSKVNVPDNGRLSVTHCYQEKPYLLLNYNADNETSYLYNLIDNRRSPPFKKYWEPGDTNYLYVYSGTEGYINAYSIQNGQVTPQFQEPQFNGYVCVNIRLIGNELQYFDGDCICFYDIQNYESIQKQPLPVQEESDLFIHNTNEKWYLLFQNPLEWEELEGDRWSTKVQLELYSFDCISHDVKKLWSLDSFANNRDTIAMDIQAGYVWLFTTSAWDSGNYFTKIPLRKIE